MKQPEHKIEKWTYVCGGKGIEVDFMYPSGIGGSMVLAEAKTMQSALKAAQRRLERLTRDVVRELEILERDND